MLETTPRNPTRCQTENRTSDTGSRKPKRRKKSRSPFASPPEPSSLFFSHIACNADTATAGSSKKKEMIEMDSGGREDPLAAPPRIDGSRTGQQGRRPRKDGQEEPNSERKKKRKKCHLACVCRCLTTVRNVDILASHHRGYSARTISGFCFPEQNGTIYEPIV